MKYFNVASILYIFVTLDMRGINDSRLISRPIHAPSHELEDTNTKTSLIKVVDKRILVELLGIREESCLLYLFIAVSIIYVYIPACCLFTRDISSSYCLLSNGGTMCVTNYKVPVVD